MTSRTTAYLARKLKEDNSMLIKRSVTEDMYDTALQVLYAWRDCACRTPVPDDDIPHPSNHVWNDDAQRPDFCIRAGYALLGESQAMSLLRNERAPTRTHRLIWANTGSSTR